MHAHELINHIVQRIGVVKWTRVYGRPPASVQFMYEGIEYFACCPSPNGKVIVEQVVAECIHEDTVRSRVVMEQLNRSAEYFGPAA